MQNGKKIYITLYPYIYPHVYHFVVGTARMDPRSNGKVGGLALGYIMIQNLLGTILGCVVCVIFKPGKRKRHL